MPSPAPPRILVVGRELTPSPRDGGTLRRRHLLEVLCRVGPTAAFGFVPGPPPCDGLAAWGTPTDPDAARTPEGAAAVAAAQEGRFPLGVVSSPSTVAELCAFARDFAPDVVVVSSVELLDYVAVLRPLAPRLVLDLDYAQAIGLGEMAAADSHRARSLLWRRMLPSVADQERAVLALVDQVWVSNDDETARVRAAASDDALDVAVVPNVVEVASYPQASPVDAGALVFPARFDYWPNEEAARTLVHDVVPHLPGATLTLVGMYPPPWLQDIDDARVQVTGRVPDVRPYLAAAACMPLPITAGKGTRMKVLEAFATGLPLVSTAAGVAGFALTDGEHYLRAETADEFIASIEVLRADAALVNQLQKNARAWVDAHGSIAALDEAISRALAATR
jgi:glycosyltransferase involved in cell wall biosynthesis